MYHSLGYTMRITIIDERLFINGNFIADHCYMPDDVGMEICKYYENEQNNPSMLNHLELPFFRCSDYSTLTNIDLFNQRNDRKKMYLNLSLSLGDQEYEDDDYIFYEDGIYINRDFANSVDLDKNIGYQLGSAFATKLSFWPSCIEEGDYVVEENGYIGIHIVHPMTKPITEDDFYSTYVRLAPGGYVKNMIELYQACYEQICEGKPPIWWHLVCKD